MQKTSPTVSSSTKLSGSPTALPSLKGKQSISQADDSSQQPRQSRDHSKEKSSFDASEGLSPEAINELKRENTTLRMKLHEMQAHTLENSIKARGIEKSPGAKGLETTLVRANSKMYQLEAIIKQKEDQIQQLSYEKRMLENIKRDQARTIETLMTDKSYYLKAGQDLQAELTNIKKTTLGNLVSENKAQKERLAAYEKRMKSDRDLIARQLQTIKLLDEKNTDISRVKCLTLNPLYDSVKRKEIYRNKNLADAGTKSELENIKTLNLAFSSDEVLEKLLEEQDQELEEEELKIAKAKGDKVDLVPKEKKILEWENEYRKIRGIYIETRFEFERIDTRLKEEINNLAKKLNETEEKFREKVKELDMVNHVLDHGKHVIYESVGARTSPNRSLNVSKRTVKVEKHTDVSNVVGHELDNQSSFHEDVKEFLKLEGQKSDPIDEKEEEERNDASSEKQEQAEEEEKEEKSEKEEEQEEKEEKEEKEEEEAPEPEKKETNFPGGIIVRLGQFNSDHTFDDHEALDRASVARMDTISLWADQKSIIGIQVTYTTKDGKPYEGMKHMGEVTKEKYSKEPWTIEQGDALAKVRGAVAVTHGIIWIEFTTRKGVVKKFGNSEIGKESFNFNFKPKETPILVMGSFSLRERGEKAAKLNLSALGFTSIEESPKGSQDGKSKLDLDKEKTSPAKGKGAEKEVKGKTPGNDVKSKAKEAKAQDTPGKPALGADAKGKKDSISAKPDAKKSTKK